MERKQKKEQAKLKKKEDRKKQYYEEQKIKLKWYKEKMQQHIEKMSIPFEQVYADEDQRNQDLVIAKEDLASIPESSVDSELLFFNMVFL